MFRPFHPHCFAPPWADANYGSALAAERFGCRGGGRGGWGDEARVRRGDIKFILLGLLAERPQHGYELIKELENRRGGFRRLSPGSVYPTLQMLEEGGYLTSEQIEGKRVYTITDSGRQLLEQRQPGASSPMEPMPTPPSELAELRKALTELGDAVTQLARSGSLEQAGQARELLNGVKREIYRLLAQ